MTRLDMDKTSMSRRTSLGLFGGLAAMALPARAFAQAPAPATAPAPAAAPTFTLPPLGYAYEALEPHIDTMTMRIHHSAHHQAFITNLNGLVARYPDLATRQPEAILADIAKVPEAVRGPVRNNLGGHWNHTYFWDLLTPGGAKEPSGDLKDAITVTFGGMDKLNEQITQAALTRFGSGWAWLAVDKDKKLVVLNTPYQDTPHMDGNRGAVIGIDVWEHAYYLKHQNRRADYVKAWMNVANWDKAAANFKNATA